MQGATQKLAEFANGTAYEAIPPEVVHEAKRMILDTIGCAIGGLHMKSGRIALEHVSELGGKPTNTVIGTTERNSAPHAAYANARLGNVLDADDTFPTGTHFGSPTVFAALAMAELQGKSGRDFIRGVAVGFDVGARIGSSMGLALRIEDGKVTGWPKVGGTSATMTWGAIGAATSVAQLGTERTIEAFGIAGGNTPLPTLRKWSEAQRLPMYKYSDAGWCAQTAIEGTLLAKLGSTGYTDLLDGELGYWLMYGAPQCNFDLMVGDFGKRWHLLDTTYKPWPSCRWTQYPLTALRSLKAKHQLRPDEITRIVVKGAPFAQSYRFKVTHPENEVNAEFSNAHVLAMMAFDVPAGPMWFTDEALTAPKYRAFRERVTTELEPSAGELVKWMENGQFRRVPGGLEVHARGQVFTEIVQMAAGDPWSTETHFSDAQLEEKFIGMVCGTNPGSAALKKRANAIIDCVNRLETMPKVDELCRNLVLDVREAAEAA